MQQIHKTRIFTILLTSVYGLLLSWLVLCKATLPGEWHTLVCERSINLIPFHYDTEVSAHLSEIVLNVLVFVPFGLFLSMLGVRVWKTVLFGFAASLAFEALEYACSIGAADLTDLLTNTTGALLGACGYLLLCRFFGNREKCNRVLNILACVGMILFLGLAAVLLIANR